MLQSRVTQEVSNGECCFHSVLNVITSRFRCIESSHLPGLRYACSPMRLSDFNALHTSSHFAPTRLATASSSTEVETCATRKRLMASFESSADSYDMTNTGHLNDWR